MSEFANLDRCAAYVAIRSVAGGLSAVARSWPALLADRAHTAAIDAMQATAEAAAQPIGSSARRRCLRDALASALAVAGGLEAARALGLADPELDVILHTLGRAVALLAMFLHASSAISFDAPSRSRGSPGSDDPTPKTTPGRVSDAQPSRPQLTRPVPTQLLRR